LWRLGFEDDSGEAETFEALVEQVRARAAEREQRTTHQLAIARRASVINMSFGFPNGTRPEKDAIERAFAAHILPVAAMGNEMPRNPILAPAEYRHTVAVGAIDISGQRWTKSQTGQHISLVAPGVAIDSTMPAGRFGSLSGTSMAAAFVSGVAALVRSHRPDLTAGAVRTILERSADPLGYGDSPQC
jgi:subtilisin